MAGDGTLRLKESRGLFAYCGLLLAVVLIYFCIRAYGVTLAAPAPLDPTAAIGSFSQVRVNDFVHVLLALALVIAAARALGAVFRVIQQPPVIGEMIAGILLGPSLLGHLAPHFAAYILPQSIAPLLNVISQVGVILYMFMVGLELDLSSLRSRAHSTITISHASIVAPFLLGAALALILYPSLSNSSVSFTAFSLFLGVSMSVTAFPVLARILTDRRIHKTRMGVLTLACAAIDDVTAWCLLAFVVSVTQSRAGRALPTLLLAIGYIAVMFVIVRPFVVRLSRWVDGKGRLTQGALAFVLLGILASSLATETIGIHSIFGAFVLGAIIPHGSALARDLTNKLEDFVIVFLLPAFFAFTGLRTQIGLVSGAQNWMFCLLIIVVASLGKFGGSAVAARLNGMNWRDASAIGVLMNTRGLMELIVLNIGLELRVISPTLFAMLVIMALATTFATTPILHFITPRRRLEEEADEIDRASRLANAFEERTGTLIPVTGTGAVAALLDVALSLTPADAPAPRVLALNRGTITGVGAKIREAETFAPSRSPALAAALDAAWSRGIAIKPEAVWTTDPASEIVEAAAKTSVRWLLLESSRSILGRYPRTGFISKILEHMAARPTNVGVLLQGRSFQSNPVTCIVQGEDDGSAALEIAILMSKSRPEELRVFVIETESKAPAKSPPADESEWSHTWIANAPVQSTVLSGVTDFPSISGGLVVIAKDVVDRSRSSVDRFTTDQSVIIVQGARRSAMRTAAKPLAVEAMHASAV